MEKFFKTSVYIEIRICDSKEQHFFYLKHAFAVTGHFIYNKDRPKGVLHDDLPKKREKY